MRLSSQGSQFIFNLPSDFLKPEVLNTYTPILEKNWVQYDNVIDYINSTIKSVNFPGIGFDMPKSLGSDETGASVALPVFIDFMKQSLKDTPSTPFRVPSSVKFVKIDRETGRSPSGSTPKDRVFFEALKLTDTIDETNHSEENGSEDSNGEEEFNDGGVDPVGIY